MLGWRQNKKRVGKVLATISAGIGVICACFIPIRMGLAYHQAPTPQAVLTLGGGSNRELTSAKLSRTNPHLEVWISSGGYLPKQSYQIFEGAGASTNRLHLDYSATDTVSNFTTILPQLKQRNIKHIYLVTSDFHMKRSQAIATIILGSHGITFTPISVPSDDPQESYRRILRDTGRSIFWVMTGKNGSELKSEGCSGKDHMQAVVELFIAEGIQCEA